MMLEQGPVSGRDAIAAMLARYKKLHGFVITGESACAHVLSFDAP
jgi:hypothetical protein